MLVTECAFENMFRGSLLSSVIQVWLELTGATAGLTAGAEPRGLKGDYSSVASDRQTLLSQPPLLSTETRDCIQLHLPPLAKFLRSLG